MTAPPSAARTHCPPADTAAAIIIISCRRCPARITGGLITPQRERNLPIMTKEPA